MNRVEWYFNNLRLGVWLKLEKAIVGLFFSNFSYTSHFKGLHSAYDISKQILFNKKKKRCRDLGLNAWLLLCGGRVLAYV